MPWPALPAAFNPGSRSITQEMAAMDSQPLEESAQSGSRGSRPPSPGMTCMHAMHSALRRPTPCCRDPVQAHACTPCMVAAAARATLHEALQVGARMHEAEGRSSHAGTALCNLSRVLGVCRQHGAGGEQRGRQQRGGSSGAGGKRKREVSRWTTAEEEVLQQAIMLHGLGAWGKVAVFVRTRTARQCKEHYREVLRCAHAPLPACLWPRSARCGLRWRRVARVLWWGPWRMWPMHRSAERRERNRRVRVQPGREAWRLDG